MQVREGLPHQSSVKTNIERAYDRFRIGPIQLSKHGGDTADERASDVSGPRPFTELAISSSFPHY
jgi:hypothetical protein